MKQNDITHTQLLKQIELIGKYQIIRIPFVIKYTLCQL